MPFAYDDCLRVRSSADRLLAELAARLCLPDSLHTNGFHKRESSLLRQLLPASAGAMRRPDE